jgi:hypothetical protein
MLISPPHCDNSCEVYRQSANVVNVKTTMERLTNRAMSHALSSYSCAGAPGKPPFPPRPLSMLPAGHLPEVQKFDLNEVQRRTCLEQLRIAVRETEAEVLRKEGQDASRS